MARTVPEPSLIPFSEGRPRTFVPFLCDGVSAWQVASFSDLLVLQARLQAERPGIRVLASLDDLGQASYTSGHGIDDHGLDDTEGHDLSGLSPEAFEDGAHRGHLSTPSEFPIRLANLRRLAADVAFGQLAGLLPWTDDDDSDLVGVNRAPDPALQLNREDPVVLLYAPVQTGADALAAFPNGYFTCDLSPMQNYALSRHLEARFGLVLFAVGSRFLAYRRGTAFDAREAEQISADVVGLYDGAPSNAGRDLARLITGRSWLLVRYTES